MDLNKEIKLSDLVRRPKKKRSRPASRSRAATKRKRRRKQEIVGLKIGASQIAASRVVNNGSAAKLVQLARGSARAGHRRRRRGARRGGTRGRARRLLHREQAAAPRHPARHRHQPHRRAHARHRRHRRRAPARERRSLPRARGAVDPARPGRARLPRRQRDGRRVRGSLPARPARGRLPGADRPLRRGMPCGEASSSRASTSRRSRCCAPSPRRERDGAPAVASVVVSIGHDRSTLAISDGTVCEFMRVLDWGGSKLEAAIARELGLTVAEAGELKLALDLGADAVRGRRSARRARPRGGRPASCRSSRGS